MTYAPITVRHDSKPCLLGESHSGECQYMESVAKAALEEK
jgi:hypothetical protein